MTIIKSYKDNQFFFLIVKNLKNLKKTLSYYRYGNNKNRYTISRINSKM